jgi:hypothetical protein
MKRGSTLNKTIHAYDDESVIVRHDSAVRWFREWPDGRRESLTSVTAARLAAELGMTTLTAPGGEKFRGELRRIQVEVSGEKTCHVCGMTKPVTDFHEHGTCVGGVGRAGQSNYNKRHRALITAKSREWRRANPQVARAYKLVAKAISSGELVRPEVCERCQAVGVRICASHDDYAKPLEVEWLCDSCHVLKDQANPRTNYGEIAKRVAS